MKIAKDKMDRVENFYVTAGYIVQLAKHSSELFKRSELEDRKLLITTVLSSITWDGEKLHYDYIFPFNLLADVQKSSNGVDLLHLREHLIKFRNLSKDKIENTIKQLLSIVSDSEEKHRNSLLHYKI